jgi:hypothetical protein
VLAAVPRLLQATAPPLPTGKLYLVCEVCDNYGAHGKLEVTVWCAANDIELVYTPTNASWLNWIECEFTAIRYFPSTAATTPTTPSSKQPSPATSAGATATATPNATSQSTR